MILQSVIKLEVCIQCSVNVLYNYFHREIKFDQTLSMSDHHDFILTNDPDKLLAKTRLKSSYKKPLIRRGRTVDDYYSEWLDEDYQSLPEQIDEVIDPWEMDSQSAAQEFDAENDVDQLSEEGQDSLGNDKPGSISDGITDYDVDYLEESYFAYEYDVHDEHDDLNLPDYDEDAQRSPWETADTVTTEPENITHFSKSRAKEISDMLDCRNDTELMQAYDYFLIFFSENPSSSTLSRVRKLAEAGIDLETFMLVVELRELWRDSCFISWELAHSICENRQDYPVEYMIDKKWFFEWKVLRYPQWYAPDPSQSIAWKYGYKFLSNDINWSFTRFLEEKLNNPELEMLDTGFIVKKDHDYFFDEIRNSDLNTLHAELSQWGQKE